MYIVLLITSIWMHATCRNKNPRLSTWIFV